MLTEKNIRDAITKSVAGFDVATLDADMDFADGGIDSLDHDSLLLQLQEDHNLVVPDEDVDKCTTINSTLEYSKTKIPQ
jgi:acyl carrier protein